GSLVTLSLSASVSGRPPHAALFKSSQLVWQLSSEFGNRLLLLVLFLVLLVGRLGSGGVTLGHIFLLIFLLLCFFGSGDVTLGDLILLLLLLLVLRRLGSGGVTLGYLFLLLVILFVCCLSSGDITLEDLLLFLIIRKLKITVQEGLRRLGICGALLSESGNSSGELVLAGDDAVEGRGHGHGNQGSECKGETHVDGSDLIK
ncbi:hypothetical protein LY78DRAFT_168155, partial [Colletotrichum sublineola]